VPVDVRLPTVLRAHAGGAATVQAEGETVGQVFEDLVIRYPGMSGLIVTPEGALHKFVNVYVNDDDVRYLDRLDTKLSEGDVVSILPAVAGGAR
jgi:molybdopterin synthase sulfur carrier subunit